MITKISHFIYFIRVLIKEIILVRKAKIVGYYEHIDYLPIYNWFKILDGKYEYLYKRIQLKKYPEYFKLIPEQMLFQFEKLNTVYFEENLKLSYLKALFIITKRWDYINQYNALKTKLEGQKKQIIKPPSLNEMLIYIEETFSSIGNIDVHKISTSKFFALYYRAIDKNNKKENVNN